MRAEVGLSTLICYYYYYYKLLETVDWQFNYAIKLLQAKYHITLNELICQWIW